MQVAKAEFIEKLERLTNLVDWREHLDRFGDFQLEQLAGVEALPAYRESFGRETHPVAGLTRDVDVGEERHLDVNRTLALALGASTLLDVEREAACRVASCAGLGGPCQELTHRVPDADVRRRNRARCASDWALIDLDGALQRPEAFDLLELTGRLVVDHPDRFARRSQQDLAHQRALARTAHAGHRHETFERESHIDVLQVVVVDPAQLQP